MKCYPSTNIKNTTARATEYQTNQTKKVIRMLVTWVLTGVLISFIVSMSKKEIKKICPRGLNGAIGGQYKRNFWTLDTDMLIVKCWWIVVPFNCIISTHNEEIKQHIGIVL